MLHRFSLEDALLIAILTILTFSVAQQKSVSMPKSMLKNNVSQVVTLYFTENCLFRSVVRCSLVRTIESPFKMIYAHLFTADGGSVLQACKVRQTTENAGKNYKFIQTLKHVYKNAIK